MNMKNGPTYGYTDTFPKREMWEGIATQFNGEYKIKHSAGNVIEIHQISIPHQKWNIMISVSDSRPLKFSISFSSSQAFDFTLSWQDFLGRITNKFSKTQTKVGWTTFDKQYHIESSQSDLVKRSITTEIQKTILKYQVYSLSFQTDKASKTALLISVIQRNAGAKDMITELIEMHKLLIDNLEESRIIQ